MITCIYCNTDLEAVFDRPVTCAKLCERTYVDQDFISVQLEEMINGDCIDIVYLFKTNVCEIGRDNSDWWKYSPTPFPIDPTNKPEQELIKFVMRVNKFLSIS